LDDFTLIFGRMLTAHSDIKILPFTLKAS